MTQTQTSSVDERPRVLIVDDEKFIRDILAIFSGWRATSSARRKMARPRSAS